MDKRSQLNCLKECGRLLGLGCSVLFFPEGTRTTDGKMAAFKKARPCFNISVFVAQCCLFTTDLHCTRSCFLNILFSISSTIGHACTSKHFCHHLLHLQGAFSIAAKSKVPVVPVTLIGTGKLMPNGKEYMVYNGSVTMIVHPSVQPQKADEMLRETRDAIASRLPAAAVHPQLSTKE